MLTIKNVKHSNFASHETNCFECSVHWDGKKVGYAENSGQGGETNIHFTDKQAQTQAEAWEKEQPKIVTDYPAIKKTTNAAGNEVTLTTINPEPDNQDCEFFSYAFTLESHIDDLIVKFLTKRDLVRALKTKLIVVDDNCGPNAAFIWKFNQGINKRWPTPEALYEKVKEVQKFQNPKCLNLMPIEAACEIWGAP